MRGSIRPATPHERKAVREINPARLIAAVAI